MNPHDRGEMRRATPSPHRAPSSSRVAMFGAVVLFIAAVAGPLTVARVWFALLVVLFGAYFVRHLMFAMCAARFAPDDLRTTDAAVWHLLPAVTVMVPCHNEELVVASMIEGLRNLNYPADRLQILLVDDGSTDRTAALLDELVGGDPLISVLHRPVGAGGGKSGALNTALAHATGEVVVVFDADHRPRPDCLAVLMRHFEDPAVAAAQGRCVIHNADDSVVARVVAIDYLGGYLVNEYGRQAAFELPAYGGANCAVRTEALRAVGGWNTASVTEDTDLTLRLVLAGHKVRYDIAAVDEEEAVTTLGRYWNQRYRWARGHQQAWRDYRATVWASPFLSPWQKVETTMFLFSFHLPALAFGGVLLTAAMALSGQRLPGASVSGIALWTLMFVGPVLESGVGLAVARVRRRVVWDLVLFVPFYALSMLICAKALADGLFGRSYDWVKTPRRAPVTGGVAS